MATPDSDTRLRVCDSTAWRAGGKRLLLRLAEPPDSRCRSETSPPRCPTLELLGAPLTWSWAADSLDPMATSNGVSAGFRVRAHPHLYEINTRTWLEQLSAQHKQIITLADVPDPEWDALAKLGFNVIWL